MDSLGHLKVRLGLERNFEELHYGALTLLLLAVKKLHKKQRQKQSNCRISYRGKLGTRLHIMGLTTQNGPHSKKTNTTNVFESLTVVLIGPKMNKIQPFIYYKQRTVCHTLSGRLYISQ